MAITDENTVLIIGAGASVPFGMPLGGALMNDIRELILKEDAMLRSVSRYLPNQKRYVYAALSNDVEFMRIPIHAAIVFKSDSQNFTKDFPQQKSKLRQLADLLNNQTSETIDGFLVENPSYSELTKICIETIFMNNLNQIGGFGSKLSDRHLTREVEGSGDIHERNWVHLLINIVRKRVVAEKVTSNNKVKIISFNYDMILEYILDQQFSNSELMKGKDWRDYFEIIHPHGKCEPFSKNLTVSAELINKWAEGIFVINEDIDKIPENIKLAREKAKIAIESSREVYVTGFAFARPNCQMLGLERNCLVRYAMHQGGISVSRPKFQRKISICNYDGNIGLSLAVDKLRSKNKKVMDEFISVTEQSGAVDRPLGVADWIKMGVLGDMPG